MSDLATVHRHPSSTGDRELLGDVLATKREELGRSQESIVGSLRQPRSQGWLSRLERGDFVRLPIWLELRDLCGVLGLNIVDLLVTCRYVRHGEVLAYLDLRETATRRRGVRS